MTIPYIVIARGLHAAPGVTLAWRTTLGQLAADVQTLNALGYRYVEARRLED